RARGDPDGLGARAAPRRGGGCRAGGYHGRRRRVGGAGGVSGRVFNLRTLEFPPEEGWEPPDRHQFRGRSLTGEVGASLTGMGVYEIEPGQAMWPYHFEVVEEEWLIVIEGEVTLRTPEGEHELRPGDVAAFPAGPSGAHAVRNDGATAAR